MKFINKKSFFTFLFILQCINTSMAASPYQIKTDANGEEYVEFNGLRYSTRPWKNSVIVKFKNGSVETVKENKLSSYGEHRWLHDKEKNVFEIKLKGRKVEDVVSELKKDPRIEKVEPNGPVFSFACSAPSNTTDPYYSTQSPVPGLCDTTLNDPAWPFYEVNAFGAWPQVVSKCPTQSVVVAVLDFGCSSDTTVTVHPDLPNSIFIPGIDETDESSNPSMPAGTTQNEIDNFGHGTEVTGLIAAQWTNANQAYLANCPNPNTIPSGPFNGGMAGMAGMPGLVKIYEVKTEYVAPPYTTSPANVQNQMGWLLQGIYDAVNLGNARVINMSDGVFQSNDPANLIGDAVNYALNHNCVVVAASGNAVPALTDDPVEPACYPGVIAVGACSTNVGQTPTVENYSNYGSSPTQGGQLTLVAPGGDLIAGFNSQKKIFTTALNCVGPGPVLGQGPGPHTYDNYYSCDNNYTTVVGTSFACPIVTGAVALMLAVNPNLKPGDVYQILEFTADPTPFGGTSGIVNWQPQSGFGLLDASAAVQKAISYIPPPPSAGGGGQGFHIGATFPFNCNGN